MNEPNDGSTAKSGWLFSRERLLCCLKQWKVRWFVLDRDCHLRYFERPENSIAKGVIVLRKPYAIYDHTEMKNVDRPQGCSEECLLEIETADDRLTLCSECPEEMREWRDILESIRGVCTAPLTEIPQVQLATPIFILEPSMMTPTTYVLQSAETQTAATIVYQAQPSHGNYVQLGAPVAVAPLLVRPV